MSGSTAASPPVSEWKDLPWTMIQRRVWKLQKRIFRAAQRGDQRAVHRLEQLLMKSWSAKCLAVRRVTQVNHGKRTPGVDKELVKTPQARGKLVDELLSKHVEPNLFEPTFVCDFPRETSPLARPHRDDPGRATPSSPARDGPAPRPDRRADTR